MPCPWNIPTLVPSMNAALLCRNQGLRAAFLENFRISMVLPHSCFPQSLPIEVRHPMSTWCLALEMIYVWLCGTEIDPGKVTTMMMRVRAVLRVFCVNCDCGVARLVIWQKRKNYSHSNTWPKFWIVHSLARRARKHRSFAALYCAFEGVRQLLITVQVRCNMFSDWWRYWRIVVFALCHVWTPDGNA